MKRFPFIFFLSFLTFFAYAANEIDIGQIFVRDSKISSYETTLMPESFSTVIDVAGNDLAQSGTLGDVLAQTTQIFVKDTGSDSSISTVSIRGSSSKNVLILLDGTPLNSGSSGSFNLNLIPASIIERVEVSRGGASSVFGSSAMGGVINIITRQSKMSEIRYIISTKNLRSANASANVSYKDKKQSVLFAVNSKIDLANYLYKDNNGTEFNTNDDYITRMSHNKNEKSDFLIKHIFDAEHFQLGYSINYTNKNNEVTGPSTFKKQYENATLNTSLMIARMTAQFGKSNKYVNGKFDLAYKFDGYTYKNASTISAEQYNQQAAHAVDASGSVNLTSIPFNYIYIASKIRRDILPEVADSLLISTTVKDEITPLDCLSITAITRLDYYSDLHEPVSFVWNAGMSYQPHPEIKLKLNGFKSFRKPDFTEMYYRQGLYIGNPNLLPETSYGGDFGFILDSSILFAEAVLFCSYYQNLISYILSSGFVYRPINVGEVLSYGLELNMNIAIIKYFNIELSYTLNFVNSLDNLSHGLFMQEKGHPLNRFFAKLNFTIFDYQFGVQFKFEDEMTLTSSGKKIPCKGLLDAYLKIDIPIKKFNLKPTIYFNANNLLNIYAYDERNYPLEGINFEAGFILTQAIENVK